MLGPSVGLVDGVSLGPSVGLVDGVSLGPSDGLVDGVSLSSVGTLDGLVDGVSVVAASVGTLDCVTLKIALPHCHFVPRWRNFHLRCCS